MATVPDMLGTDAVSTDCTSACGVVAGSDGAGPGAGGRGEDDEADHTGNDTDAGASQRCFSAVHSGSLVIDPTP